MTPAVKTLQFEPAKITMMITMYNHSNKGTDFQRGRWRKLRENAHFNGDVIEGNERFKSNFKKYSSFNRLNICIR